MEDEWTGRAKGNLYLLDTTATVFSSFSIPYIASNVTCQNKTSAEYVSACFDSLTSVKNKCHNVIYGMLDLEIPPFLDSYCSLFVFHILL